jgi:hypothetical protein
MTTSPDESLKFNARRSDTEEPTEQEDKAVDRDTELAPDGYDDRQENLKESDADLFARKRRDPEARYRPEDEPLSEPRKQPRRT